MRYFISFQAYMPNGAYGFGNAFLNAKEGNATEEDIKRWTKFIENDKNCKQVTIVFFHVIY